MMNCFIVGLSWDWEPVFCFFFPSFVWFSFSPHFNKMQNFRNSNPLRQIDKDVLCSELKTSHIQLIHPVFVWFALFLYCSNEVFHQRHLCNPSLVFPVNFPFLFSLYLNKYVFLNRIQARMLINGHVVVQFSNDAPWVAHRMIMTCPICIFFLNAHEFFSDRSVNIFKKEHLLILTIR